MYNFAGFASFENDISKDKYVLENMSLKLDCNLNKVGVFIQQHIALSGLNIESTKDEFKHPMSIMCENTLYTIVLNGKIYNKSEIKKGLLEVGCKFIGDSDKEVILRAFIYFGESIFSKINGFFSFALWNDKKQELYLVRDHFGIKPLYYTILNNTIIFSSKIKAILEYPGFEVQMDEMGIAEMFGLRSSTYTRYLCI